MSQTVFLPKEPVVVKPPVVSQVVCAFTGPVTFTGGLVSNRFWCAKGEKVKSRWPSLECCLIPGGAESCKIPGLGSNLWYLISCHCRN